MANTELLRKTLEHITAHPEEWEQTWWATRRSCGTAYCLAGHVAVATGHRIAFPTGCELSCSITDGREIAEIAEIELGLNSRDAHLLFAANNTLRRLWSLASRITNGEISVPEDVPYAYGETAPAWEDAKDYDVTRIVRLDDDGSIAF
jgi:hypothetical protein